MFINPVKSAKNSLLNFIRYFYDENATYVDNLFKRWIKFFVPAFITIFFTGFIAWLFFLSIIWLFSTTWIKLGPGFWNLLNILQLGLIIWVSEGIYKFLRLGGKK